MPLVRRPPVLQSVYRVTSEMIRRWQMPTELIQPDRAVFRASDRKYLEYFVSHGRRMVNRKAANQCLVIRDQNLDVNRFTGQSLSAGVPSSGGLYCSLQAPALVNELVHYARGDPRVGRSGTTGFPLTQDVLQPKFIAKIRLMSSVLAADLSPHNPGARQFVEAIGNSGEFQAALQTRVARESALSERPIWEQLYDGEDCSVARGIGLAVAHSGSLRALVARTARPSPRMPEETGDNLVFFGNGGPIPGLWIEEVYAFPPGDRPAIFPVEFKGTP
jgi:hypothetical protein